MPLYNRTRPFSTLLPPPITLVGAGVPVTPTAGRIYLIAVDVPADCTARSVIIANGSTVSGNGRVGIYGPLSAPYSPNNEPLVAQSASVPLVGTDSPQEIDLTAPVALRKGQYYIGYAVDNATHRFLRAPQASPTVATSSGYFTQAYDAFPATMPTLTPSNDAKIVLSLRVTPFL